jgi:hypothetical protein
MARGSARDPDADIASRSERPCGPLRSSMLPSSRSLRTLPWQKYGGRNTTPTIPANPPRDALLETVWIRSSNDPRSLGEMGRPIRLDGRTASMFPRRTPNETATCGKATSWPDSAKPGHYHLRPGALVDLPNYAAIVGGLEFWQGTDRQIFEERLVGKLQSPVQLLRTGLLARHNFRLARHPPGIGGKRPWSNSPDRARLA